MLSDYYSSILIGLAVFRFGVIENRIEEGGHDKSQWKNYENEDKAGNFIRIYHVIIKVFE